MWDGGENVSDKLKFGEKSCWVCEWLRWGRTGRNLGDLFPLCKLASHTYDFSCKPFQELPRFNAIKSFSFPHFLSLLRSLHSAFYIWCRQGELHIKTKRFYDVFKSENLAVLVLASLRSIPMHNVAHRFHLRNARLRDRQRTVMLRAHFIALWRGWIVSPNVESAVIIYCRNSCQHTRLPTTSFRHSLGWLVIAS